MSNINIDNLIGIASKGLGIPPEQLRKALKEGDVSGITANMSAADREKVNRIFNDPKLAEQFKKQMKVDKS